MGHYWQNDTGVNLMWWSLIAQITIPTPTPFPDTPVEGFDLEIPDISLWSFTDEAIQVWNKGEPLVSLLQAVILIGLIIGAVLIIASVINRVTQKNG